METLLKIALPMLLPSMTRTVKNLLAGALAGGMDKLEALAAKTPTQVDDEIVAMLHSLADGGQEALAAMAPVFQPMLDSMWVAAKATPNPYDNAGVSLLAGVLGLELQG